MIHSTLHAARPDVLCAAHTHSIHGKAFSSLGIPLDMLTQDTCAFYNVAIFTVFLNLYNALTFYPIVGPRSLQSIQRCGIGCRRRKGHCSRTGLQEGELFHCFLPPATVFSEQRIKAAILQNHGILVATDSIEATIFFFIALEKACQVQLMADAAAAGLGRATVKIDPADALNTYRTNGNLRAGWFQGLPEFQLLEAREGKKYDGSK